MINHRIVTAGDLRKTTTNFDPRMVSNLGNNQCVSFGTPDTYLYGNTFPNYNNGLWCTWPKIYYTS